jgi:hypothetical protein
MFKPLPIGIQDFRKLIGGGSLQHTIAAWEVARG